MKTITSCRVLAAMFLTGWSSTLHSQNTTTAKVSSGGNTHSININHAVPLAKPAVPVYSIRALPLPADHTSPWIVALNDKGQVLGNAYISASRRDVGVLWTDGNPTTLSGFGGGDTIAYGLNNKGVVVGASESPLPSMNGYRAFRWTAESGFADLNVEPGPWESYAYGINDADQITGVSYGAHGVGFLLQSGTAIFIPPSPGFDYFHPRAINSRGSVVGWQYGDRRVIPALYRNGITTPLAPGGEPYALNSRDEAVGRDSVNREGAVFWDASGAIKTLPLPSSIFYASAQAINDAGMIAGNAVINNRWAAVYWPSPTTPAENLSALLPTAQTADWNLTNANAINNWGQIAGMGYYKGVQTPFLLSPQLLFVDADRDGQIKLDGSDTTSQDKPYRFWINDDDDSGDDKRSSTDDLPLPNGDDKRDSENTKVDGIRDLEDFSPVYFDIRQLLTMLPPGTNGISYYLKQQDSALGVVFTNYTKAQAFEYLRGSPTGLDTGFGPSLTQKAGDATVTKVTAAGVDITAISPAFFDCIRNNGGGVLLVEASTTTIKPLVLEVRKGSDVVVEFKLELKIDPVETMFHYVNLRSFAHGTLIASNNQGPRYGSTTPTAAPNDPFATAANRKNLIFVHGYNVNSEAARGSAATAFKRFYWSGSKAKFHAVLWRGDDGQGASGATPDYHRNVGHAWQQGPLFRDFLGTLQGDTAIMAHSLGNVVTQVALTRASDPNNPARLVPAPKPATVKHYFAVDAAVPLEATSSTDITSESKSRLRHSWWAEYDSQERLWPSHWHQLFTGTGDAREGLTWQNVFANLEVGTNFYSSGEEVLANPVNDGMPVWEPLFFAGLRAWVAQEKLKGGNGIAAPLFRSRTAGWVENRAWYMSINPAPPVGSPQTRPRFASEAQDVAAPGGVPTSALASEPFFQRFQAIEDGVFYPGYQGSRLHAPISDANADDEARKLVTVAKCLGEAIPALSYPQGSNPASAFTRPGMGGNLNLNTSDFKNGWPPSRGSDSNWKHSDCLDVSYLFHFKLYDRMKTDGGLQ